jgi:hypothetical protein
MIKCIYSLGDCHLCTNIRHRDLQFAVHNMRLKLWFTLIWNWRSVFHKERLGVDIHPRAWMSTPARGHCFFCNVHARVRISTPQSWCPHPRVDVHVDIIIMGVHVHVQPFFITDWLKMASYFICSKSNMDIYNVLFLLMIWKLKI